MSILLLIFWLLAWLVAFSFPGTTLGACSTLLGSAGFIRLASKNQKEISLKTFYLAGVIFYLLALSWMPEAILLYFSHISLEPQYAIAGYCLSALYLGLQFPLVFFILRIAPKVTPWLLPALAWCSIEALFPTPFPWNIGAFLRGVEILSGPGELLGVSFVSLVVLSLLGICLVPWKSGELWKRTVLLCAMSTALFIFQNSRATRLNNEIEQSPTIRVALVQGNDAIERETSSQQIEEKVKTYLTLSQSVMPQPDLLLWPEGAYAGVIPQSRTNFPAHFGTKTFPIRRPLLFAGRTSLVPPDQTERFTQVSTLLLSPGEKLSHEYHKRKTFPFAEDVPFKHTFPFLTDVFGERNFLPGTKGTVTTVERPRGRARQSTGASYSLSSLICYEDLWPSLFQQTLNENNAQLLVGLSNSQWFPAPQTIHLHALLASWRAIENGRYLLRAASVGMTQAIDPFGRVIGEIAPYHEGVLVQDKIPLLSHRTLFTRIGALPLQLFFSCFLLASVFWYIYSGTIKQGET